MAIDYRGKSNKELIIEVIGVLKGMQRQLKECRPTCFNNKDEIIKIQEDYKNFKFIMAGLAGFITIMLNGCIWLYKKFKGG